MKKAVFVPLDKKNDNQILQDMALTRQQRVDRMFELINVQIRMQKRYILPDRDNCITLHRNGSIPKGS